MIFWEDKWRLERDKNDSKEVGAQSRAQAPTRGRIVITRGRASTETRGHARAVAADPHMD